MLILTQKGPWSNEFYQSRENQCYNQRNKSITDSLDLTIGL